MAQDSPEVRRFPASAGSMARHLAGVDGLTMLGLGPFALLLQILFAAETQIGLALGDQTFSVFPVNLQTLGLTIGSIRSAQVRPFVPIETQPLEVGDELVFKTGLAAFNVRVFDAQHHGAAILSGKKPVEQGGTCIANVQMPGGRGRKTYADRRSRSHQKMLADKTAHVGAGALTRPAERSSAVVAPASRRLSRGHLALGPGGTHP